MQGYGSGLDYTGLVYLAILGLVVAVIGILWAAYWFVRIMWAGVHALLG